MFGIRAKNRAKKNGRKTESQKKNRARLGICPVFCARFFAFARFFAPSFLLWPICNGIAFFYFVSPPTFAFIWPLLSVLILIISLQFHSKHEQQKPFGSKISDYLRPSGIICVRFLFLCPVAMRYYLLFTEKS